MREREKERERETGMAVACRPYEQDMDDREQNKAEGRKSEGGGIAVNLSAFVKSL